MLQVQVQINVGKALGVGTAMSDKVKRRDLTLVIDALEAASSSFAMEFGALRRRAAIFLGGVCGGPLSQRTCCPCEFSISTKRVNAPPPGADHSATKAGGTVASAGLRVLDLLAMNYATRCSLSATSDP